MDNSTRVMAYDLAKVIEQKDMEKVTGGYGTPSSHRSLLPSGESLPSLDIVMDFSVDF